MKIDKAQWLSVPEEVNSVWIYSKAFQCEKPCKATLEIAGDKDIAVYVNGECLPFSQLSDVPGEKSVTTWKVSLKAGKNVINVELFNLNFQFAHYDNNCKHGFACIIYEGDKKVLCQTDATWHFCRNNAYVSVLDNVSNQLGKCFCYDARKASDWHVLETGGKKAIAVDYHPQYISRAVPPLLPVNIPAVRVVQFGYLKRTLSKGSFAAICQADY